jgi:uncharacterized membrane protein YbhN (UPF0104 family)
MRRPSPERLNRALASSYLEQSPAHTVLFILIALELAAGALIGLMFIAGPIRVIHLVAHPRWWWLPIALAASFVSYLGYLFAYRECASAGSTEPDLRWRHAGALVAGGFGLFIPRGGFALDVDALERAGFAPREARVSMLSLSTLEYAVLAPATFCVSILLLARGWHLALAVPLSWAIGVPVGTVVALWLLPLRRELARRGGWRGRLAHALDGIDQTMRIWRDPRRGLLAFAGMAVYWAADIFVLWACLAVFLPGGHPGVAKIVLAYATGYALTRRALPFAGAGAVEVLLPLALTWTGVALAPAVLAVVAYRVFNLWLPLVPAVAAVFLLRRGRLAR